MEAARRHKGLLMLALLAGTAAAALLSLCVGSVSLSLGEVTAALLGRGQGVSGSIVLYARLPRMLAALVCGCDGVVSGCSGPFPEAYVAVYKAFQSGDLEGARKAQVAATELVKLMQFGGDMSIFKNILTFRGVTGGHMRKPLLDLTDEQVAQLKQQVAPYI